jgi:hypothetical protein
MHTSLGDEPTQDAYRYNLRLASFDSSVTDYVGNTQFAADDPFTFDGPPRQPTPTKLVDITSRLIAPRSRYLGSVNDVVYEVTATFKKDQQFKRLDLAEMHYGEYPNEYDHLFIRDSEGKSLSWVFNVGDKFDRHGKLGVGDYVYQSNVLGGAPGVVALSDNISYDSQARSHQIYVDGGGGMVKAGDKVTARFIVFMRPFDDQNNSVWLEKYIKDFGIGGPPVYAYRVSQGTMRGIDYFFDVDSADGGAVVSIGQCDLEHNLTERVFGLPDDAVTGEYDLDTKMVRMLAVNEGTIIASIDTEKRDHKLYVGELIRCDDPLMKISLVPDGTDFDLEVNNPTARATKCHITGVPSFAPLAGTDLSLALAPGMSDRRKLESAPGSVVVGPWLER